MVEARAEVGNPELQLRNGMFGRARIAATGPSGETILVPSDAVQYIDEQPFVFIRLADDLYEVRRTEIGVSSGGMIVISSGLDSDEEIVVAHSFALKSELLKSRLGAGCVDH
jgi:cobalt-zinc-cadmium efflux system membrane fusion protein